MLISTSLVSNNCYNKELKSAKDYNSNQVVFEGLRPGKRKIATFALLLSMLAGNLPANAAKKKLIPRSSTDRVVITIKLPDYSTTRLGRIHYDIISGIKIAANKMHLYPDSKMPPKVQNGWSKNIRVLASNAQNEVGTLTLQHSYLKSLADELEKDNVYSIEQANDRLHRKGYKAVDSKFAYDALGEENKVAKKEQERINAIVAAGKGYKTYRSFETPGSKLGIFDKTVLNKNRYILALTSEDKVSNPDDFLFKRVSDEFVDRIQKLYNIPRENIIQITTKSPDDFKSGITSIASKIKQSKNPKNAELAAVYSGDGFSSESRKGAKYIQGAMDGALSTSNVNQSGVSEDEVKNLFNNELKDIDTLFIDFSCNSGAFIK